TTSGIVFFRDVNGHLRAFDSTMMPVTPPQDLGAIADAAVAGGVATLRLNNGAVQFWNPTLANPVPLNVTATVIAMSQTYIAALVGSASDPTLAVHPASATGTWTNVMVGQTPVHADQVQVCGSIVVFRTNEAKQGTDLNGDMDQNDEVLQF